MPVLSKAVKSLNPTTLYKIGMGYALKDHKYLVKKKAHVAGDGLVLITKRVLAFGRDQQIVK